jgi:thioesterase domain-containing protein
MSPATGTGSEAIAEAEPEPNADPPADGSARLELLRAGQPDETLFLVPGVEGEAAELVLMVSAFSGPQTVVAVVPPTVDGAGGAELGMRELAAAMLPAVRSRQPKGPYRLGGYSFGALLALEMAQQLRAAGETVDALFLIEGIYDERYWPKAVWWRALVRRSGRQLGRIVRMPPRQAFGELRHRCGRLAQRFARRRSDVGADALRSGETAAATRGYAVMARYRPQYYAGQITLIASTSDRHFGCDTALLWIGMAERVDVERVDSDHLTVMHEPAHAAVLAGIIDHRLALSRPGWAGLQPRAGFARPLLLTTMQWFSATRLAHAMVESGFEVSACHPRGHTLALVDGLIGSYRLRRLSQSRSVLDAIRAARPDVVLPDDERALALLRRLYAQVRFSDPVTAAVLARSLGNVDDWPSIVSRTRLAYVAQSLGIDAPRSDVVDTAADLREWVASNGLPVALKTDGSWGGRGVAIVHNAPALRDRWQRLSSPPTLHRAFKRLLVNQDTDTIVNWAWRRRPVVNAQEYVGGREAVVTAACLDGKVLNLVCLLVVQASEERGPASVVQTIDHPGIAEAARRLVAAFGLSGFCGFDFILAENGTAWLIELNPRVTPTSYLLVDGDYLRERTIALFPLDESVSGEVRIAALCDRPVRAPALARHGDRDAARHGLVTRRAARRMRTTLASRSEDRDGPTPLLTMPASSPAAGE